MQKLRGNLIYQPGQAWPVTSCTGHLSKVEEIYEILKSSPSHNFNRFPRVPLLCHYTQNQENKCQLSKAANYIHFFEITIWTNDMRYIQWRIKVCEEINVAEQKCFSQENCVPRFYSGESWGKICPKKLSTDLRINGLFVGDWWGLGEVQVYVGEYWNILKSVDL